MGCCHSKQDDNADIEMQPGRPSRRPQNQAVPQVSAPVGGPVMVPPPYRGTGGVPIRHQEFELDRHTIIAALNDMSTYLERQNMTATVVTVGGAVNTVFLKSRQSTHDVDFFLANPANPQHRTIYEAAKFANRQSQGRLGANWFNNSTQLFLTQGTQAGLVEAALQQNVVVFRRVSARGGLIAYAAPWSYSFCGKLNRLCETERREYDVFDAASYLNQYLLMRKETVVDAHTIRGWCENYRKKVTKTVLGEVNEAYHELYGSRPIRL